MKTVPRAHLPLPGHSKPVQIAGLGAPVNDLVNLAINAAFDIDQVCECEHTPDMKVTAGLAEV